MKLNYKTAVLASSLLLGGAVAAMAQTPPAPAAEAGQKKPADPAHVMAVIDGKPLTAGQLDEWAKIISPAKDLSVEQRRLQTLRVLVNLQAFADAARAEKLDDTQEFRKRMELTRESTLQQLYVDKKIMSPVPESELKARYDQEIAALPKEQEIHARHILVKTRDEADALLKRLGKGEDFEKLAKEQSTDGSASLGGDLGYFTKGQMVKPFEDAAFALKAGQYTTTPVETPFGWHIIKVEDMRTKEPPAFDEAKLFIQNLIMRQRYEKLQQSVLAGLKVSYPDPAVAKAMEQPVAAADETDETDEFEDQ